MKIIITLLKITLGIVVFALLGAYIYLRSSLPSLDSSTESTGVTQFTSIERDALGTAIIKAENRRDAAYALGYAHGQDRFFQMDLLRRNAAGELSEIVGKMALEVDKSRRFHQFRKRAKAIVSALPEEQSKVLERYTLGVNEALASLTAKPFEYMLTGSSPAPWQPEDSLLVSFTMYLDLQHSQVQRDLALSELSREFGSQMVDFLVQTSHYQAALDGSLLPLTDQPVPSLPEQTSPLAYLPIEEPLDIGSNNWAVTGQLTESGHALLADDMHLSLRVPIIWYRAQINYQENGQQHQVTGVSLPGTPAIVVGSNSKVAWGFTNANLDNVDWIALDESTQTQTVSETIKTPDGETNFDIEMSQYGPVKTVSGQRYALAWVAHQPYAVDLELAGMEQAKNVDEAMAVAEVVGIPVQNMMIADTQGNAAWKAAGAITARKTPSYSAISEQEYSALWSEDEPAAPFVKNPEHGRLWTGNSRVISASDIPRYGDGGYALGARAAQIRDRMFEHEQFDEQTFYQIQLDNEARFLTKWHTLLTTTLTPYPEQYQLELAALKDWKQCACAESVGYTLVRRFRSTVIELLMAPLAHHLESVDLSLSPVLRHVEPGIWQILDQQPSDWLPAENDSYSALLKAAFDLTRQTLADKHQNGQISTLEGLTWGEVNALKVEHPFARQIPLIGEWLNMPVYQGFGDSYMPAVQGPQFGASQRLLVQPGREQDAILTVPGGQSGHPLSKYYKVGFTEYAEHQSTPLLPGEIMHTVTISPNN